MTPGLIAFLLLGQLAAAAPDAAAVLPPEDTCLPDHSGFLSMRLRGSIEAELDWRGSDLHCTGMSRPDGRGLRLRFSGPLPGAGELAIVFAAPELGMGVSARGVPVNITVLDRLGQRVYGTLGDRNCAFDEVVQQPLPDPALPSRSFRVSGRGFCTAPARAVDGDGAVLLTRFDFAGMVTFQEDDGAAPIADKMLK
jgi:hypothetical protein